MGRSPAMSEQESMVAARTVFGLRQRPRARLDAGKPCPGRREGRRCDARLSVPFPIMGPGKP
jgi:hypothetical protein